MYYTLQTSMVSADKCNMSRRGLTRVAYPGQGDARARMWDRQEVEHPRLSRLITNHTILENRQIRGAIGRKNYTYDIT